MPNGYNARTSLRERILCVPQSSCLISKRMASQDEHTMRVNGKINHNLVEMYCLSCGVLIAASPHPGMLDFTEAIHSCRRNINR